MRYMCLLGIVLASSSLSAAEKIVPNIDIVEIDSAMSDVSLSTSKENVVKLQYTIKNPLLYEKFCRLEISDTHRTLKFKSYAHKGRDGAPCQMDIQVSLPENKIVSLSLGKGDVHAKGAFQKISTEIGMGHLCFGDKHAFSTKVAELNLGIGDVQVNLDRLPENADILVEVGSGSVSFSSRSVPKIGKVRFELGSGNSEISFPKGSLFGAEFSSAWGRMTSELPISKKADFTVEASSGVGSLRILEKKE
jgi:hypothetical protein